MSYYDPYDLVVGIVAEALEAACKTAIDESDESRVDLVETYDFSGDPTKADITAIKILVKPDTQTGANRGDHDESYQIGGPARTRTYHVVVDIDAFLVKVTRDRAEVRDIISKIRGRADAALALLATTASGSTADGHWSISRAATPFIQGGGPDVQDAGRNRSLRGRASLVVGFVLQWRS